MNRRIFLLQSLVMMNTLPAFGLGNRSLFDVGELLLPTGTLSRPGAWKRALFELVQTTSIESNTQAFQIEPESMELFMHPFCVLIGDGEFAPLSEKSIGMLQRFLSYGGFLLVDDTTGNPESPFIQSVRRMSKRLFPTRGLAPLRGDHSIYRSYFLLERPAGRLLTKPILEGVNVNGVTPLVVCYNDLSGALDRGEDGRDRFAVLPGGEWQRREALKLAINLMMYALTSNYKHDQAHVAELIKDGRLIDAK